MKCAWIVLLAGCSFESSPGASDGNSSPGNPTEDAPIATIDAPIVVDVMPDAFVIPPPCVMSAHAGFSQIVCATTAAPPIMVPTASSIDTDSTTPNAEGLFCAELTSNSANVCAIAAISITIPIGVVVSAHGSRPLVLLAHSIDIEGTVDVASHIGRVPGAGSDTASACQPGVRATGNGGGPGGTFNSNPGGNGGSVTGSVSDKGGVAATTVGIGMLRGGCAGGPSSDTATLGNAAHGGGAVALAVDSGGTLTLGATATISASGAGGPGGAATAGHRGGFGGGSGGLIVLLAPTLALAPTAQVVANGGGGGGGGGAGAEPGSPGADPPGATSGGSGGSGASGNPAAGGAGYPAVADQRTGIDATGSTNGAGGGGGGSGVILIDAAVTGTAVMSPPPTTL